jgi:hypothetical protein
MKAHLQIHMELRVLPQDHECKCKHYPFVISYLTTGRLWCMFACRTKLSLRVKDREQPASAHIYILPARL